MDYAFFDVDTQWGDPAHQCLRLREHLRDMAPVYDRLFALIGASKAPLVTTLCLQSPLIDMANNPAWVWIPQAGAAADWSTRVAGGRRFMLEKRTCGCSEENVARRAYDVFHAHPHAARLIELIGIRRWFVFGRSELCVGAVVDGLCGLGCEVTLVSDAVAPGGRGNAETVRELLARSDVDNITVDELAVRLAT